MLAGRQYMQPYNQKSEVVYIFLRVGSSKIKMGNTSKGGREWKRKASVRNQTDELMMTNQLDIAMHKKTPEKAVVTDVVITTDSNIKKKEHETLRKVLKGEV